MKKILIEITFDEDRFRNGIWILRSQNDNKHWEDLNFKKLHLPTDEERMEQIKNIAVKFFYYWWNTLGENTEEGFDEWADGDGKSLIDQLLKGVKND